MLGALILLFHIQRRPRKFVCLSHFQRYLFSLENSSLILLEHDFDTPESGEHM